MRNKSPKKIYMKPVNKKYNKKGLRKSSLMKSDRVIRTTMINRYKVELIIVGQELRRLSPIMIKI